MARYCAAQLAPTACLSAMEASNNRVNDCLTNSYFVKVGGDVRTRDSAMHFAPHTHTDMHTRGIGER